MKNNNNVILGGSGFIGNALCNELKRRNRNVFAFSSNEVDLLKSESVNKLNNILNNEDTVIFISAIAPCKDEDSYNKNIIMINNFIKSLEKKRPDHIIYISSDAIYDDSYYKIKESSKSNPANFHAKMHLDREKILHTFMDSNNLNYTILRPTLVYGPGDTHNGYGPNKFMRAVNSEENIDLFGKGEEQRDHIFIFDLAKIIVEVIENKIIGDFILATGKVTSFFDIAKIIRDIKENNSIKINFKPRSGPMPHNGYRAFDITKLKKNIPNVNFTSIEEGIRKSINLMK